MGILTGSCNMKHFFLACVAFLSTVSVASGVTCSYVGNSVTVCRLEVVQDVSIERPSTNYNYLDHLLIGLHPDFPLKRSLLQFEDLLDENDCKVKEAYMYVHFDYAHKASFQTADEAPYLKEYAQLHVVNQRWLEAEATSTLSMTDVAWSGTYLALDGSDAESDALTTTAMNIESPSRFVEFKVTDAVKDWASGDVANNGLLMKVRYENNNGRDLRFYSNASEDTTMHAFINVICKES